MRTASMVLGIVGGVLAIIFAIIVILIGYSASYFIDSVDSMDSDEWHLRFEDQDIHFETDMNANIPDFASKTVRSIVWIPAILSFAGAALAIIGAVFVKKKNTMAGVLMIVAAVLSFFTAVGFLASVILVVGGILALVPENKGPLTVPPANPQ